MDKLKTQILLISLMLVLLFSVQSVAAATDGDGNLTSESIDLSICDNTDDVKLSNTVYASNSPGVVLHASNLDILSDDTGTYSELAYEITSGGKYVELQHDYYIYDHGSTIGISTPDVIDGKGAVIDMNGSDIQVFIVSTHTTIKNLTIKNANGRVFEFMDSGTLENCNIINNIASYRGAVYFNNDAVVKNCNFTNNTAAGGDGGALYLKSGGLVKNCNFVNNHAIGAGGAIWSASGSVEDCIFVNNTASNGGAIWIDYGSVINCNFTNNNATISGGAVYFNGNGEVTNCNFTNNSASDWGGAIYMYSGSVEYCNFVNNHAIGAGGAIWSASGSVEDCNFTNNTATSSDGGAIYFSYSNDRNIVNCNFIGNKATGDES
ncbi:MAG: right-handed parallel beta-helix repeat-containing protein, partial [Methanobrevibacter sp.]